LLGKCKTHFKNSATVCKTIIASSFVESCVLCLNTTSSASDDTETVRENPQEKNSIYESRCGGLTRRKKGRHYKTTVSKIKIDGLLDGILRVYDEIVGLSQHILLLENPIPQNDFSDQGDVKQY
jgi:hypothetical protein